jgi:hypothetical protein
MRNKYKDRDDLVFITVHLLDTDKDKRMGRAKIEELARKVLTNLKVDFTNLFLDEPDELWRQKLDVAGVPCLYLFDRENRWVGKYLDADEAAAGLDKELPRLLKR